MTMVKQLIRIFCAFIFIFGYGCNEDLLDSIPNDRISSSVFWNTTQDAELASNAVYPFLLENAWVFVMWDAMSDIGHVTLQWRAESILEKGDIDASHSIIENRWNYAYKGIQAANLFLANVENIDTDETQIIDRLKAEVRAIRAYLYINLALLYGDVPLSTSPLDVQTSREIVRTPVKEVWDFIDNELTEVSSILPLEQSETGRITKGAALGLKARAMLYAGRYSDAADAALSVIELQQYDLYPSYESLFGYDAENNNEIILDRQYIKSLHSNDIAAHTVPNSIWTQINQFVPTKRGVDHYKMSNGLSIDDPDSGFDPSNPYDNRDPRLKYTIFTLGDILPNGEVYDPRPNSGTSDAIGYSENSTFSGFNVKKYLNSEDLSDPHNCGINIILMRYAEVLLTYAEAKIENNDIDESVYQAINQIRSRPDVNMPLLAKDLSQSELRDIVREERLAELAFEGFRYFDIRRWKIAENVLPGIIYGMTYTKDNGELSTISLSGWSKSFKPERDYLWPIPSREIELNPNLTQNPNW